MRCSTQCPLTNGSFKKKAREECSHYRRSNRLSQTTRAREIQHVGQSATDCLARLRTSASLQSLSLSLNDTVGVWLESAPCVSTPRGCNSAMPCHGRVSPLLDQTLGRLRHLQKQSYEGSLAPSLAISCIRYMVQQYIVSRGEKKCRRGIKKRENRDSSTASARKLGCIMYCMR